MKRVGIERGEVQQLKTIDYFLTEYLPEPPSSRIRYEYGGNCCLQILFNQERIKALLQVINTPNKTLVIREGNERRDDFDMIPFMHKGWPVLFPTPERKGFSTIKQTEDLFVLAVNSQVIDGRIQERCENFDTAQYQKVFTDILARTISWGISVWAIEEMNEALKGKSFLERAKGWWALVGFWRKDMGQMVIGVE